MASPSPFSITKPSNDSQKSMQGRTFSGLGNLVKPLPTGTVFLFQFLNPILTNNGKCSTNIYKYLSASLIGLCGFFCCYSSFTDSYVGSDGMCHYGIATTKGIWPSTKSESVDTSKYKLRFGDFVHASFSLVVFAVLSLLDPNTIGCFYPSFDASIEKMLLKVLPVVIGAVSGVVFMLFPYKRHGIGYPSSNSSS